MNGSKTHFIAPASFLTQVPEPSHGSLDAFIAGYVAPGISNPQPSTTPGFAFPDRTNDGHNDMSKVKDDTMPKAISDALADFKASSDFSTGLSVAAVLTQSMTSAVKRLTQGQ